MIIRIKFEFHFFLTKSALGVCSLVAYVFNVTRMCTFQMKFVVCD